MTSDENKECPYVTGNVTRYCTLTPFTLTDAEREAVEWYANFPDGIHAATLRGLLERLSGSAAMSDAGQSTETGEM